jgi:hypothetical protein
VRLRFCSVVDLVLAFGCVVGGRSVAGMLLALGIVVSLPVFLLIMGMLLFLLLDDLVLASMVLVVPLTILLSFRILLASHVL